MSQPLQSFARLLACAVLLFATAVRAQTLTTLLSGKGAEAKTLVIYSDIHVPYSLADDVAALKLQLRRVATQIEVVSVAQAEAAKISAADYLVIFCPQPFPNFPEALLQAIADRQNPVLWVGYGADQLETFAPFKDKFKVAAFASEQAAHTITYQGRDWKETLSLWIPVQIPATVTNSSVIMSVPADDAAQMARPFAWKTAHAWFFAALPMRTGNCALFGDLLLDFYGATVKPSGVVGIRIDGYHCRQDHEEFRNIVKSLSARNHPFIVGVIPAYYDVVKEKVLDLDSQPEFVAALRFAQKNGGRLIMQGYLSANKGRVGPAPEFWDASSDRPLAESSSEYVRERLEKGLQQMFAKGLFPIGWETPFYSASRSDYAEIARFFSTSVERVQLSDATAHENFAGPACATDDYGRFIVPENLGTMTSVRNPSPLVRMQSRAAVRSQLRGTVSLCSFPAYLGDGKLAPVVTMLEQFQSPFLDLADGDHWVQASDTLLLTGNAKRTVNLNNARVRWQAFDRSGKLLLEEIEPTPVTGAREFVRRGQGDYEIYQFNQVKP